MWLAQKIPEQSAGRQGVWPCPSGPRGLEAVVGLVCGTPVCNLCTQTLQRAQSTCSLQAECLSVCLSMCLTHLGPAAPLLEQNGASSLGGPESFLLWTLQSQNLRSPRGHASAVPLPGDQTRGMGAVEGEQGTHRQALWSRCYTRQGQGG